MGGGAVIVNLYNLSLTVCFNVDHDNDFNPPAQIAYICIKDTPPMLFIYRLVFRQKLIPLGRLSGTNFRLNSVKCDGIHMGIFHIQQDGERAIRFKTMGDIGDDLWLPCFKEADEILESVVDLSVEENREQEKVEV